DPIRSIFDCQSPRDRVQPSLGEAGKRGMYARYGLLSQRRADIDDLTATFPLHESRGCLRHVEEPRKVSSHDSVEVLGRVFNTRLRHEDAGIVDEPVDPSEPPLGAVNQLLRRRRLADIAIDQQQAVRWDQSPRVGYIA